MKPILTRCGHRCDLCLAYRPNIEKHPDPYTILPVGAKVRIGADTQQIEILEKCVTDRR